MHVRLDKHVPLLARARVRMRSCTRLWCMCACACRTLCKRVPGEVYASARLHALTRTLMHMHVHMSAWQLPWNKLTGNKHECNKHETLKEDVMSC